MKYIVLVISFIIGLLLYYVLLFDPLSGWIVESVLTPLGISLFPGNINIGEGLMLWLIGLVLVYILFFLPYLLSWGIIIAIIVLKKNTLFYIKKISIK